MKEDTTYVSVKLENPGERAHIRASVYFPTEPPPYIQSGSLTSNYTISSYYAKLIAIKSCPHPLFAPLRGLSEFIAFSFRVLFTLSH